MGIEIGAVAVGLALFAMALDRFFRIYKLAGSPKYKSRLLALGLMVLGFLVGYLFFLRHLINVENVTAVESLVAGIFFGGSVFVYVCAVVFYSTTESLAATLHENQDQREELAQQALALSETVDRKSLELAEERFDNFLEEKIGHHDIYDGHHVVMRLSVQKVDKFAAHPNRIDLIPRLSQPSANRIQHDQFIVDHQDSSRTPSRSQIGTTLDVALPGLIDNGKDRGYLRPFPLDTRHHDLTTVILGDTLGCRQAQATAQPLGREERFEDPRMVRGRNSAAIIAYSEVHIRTRRNRRTFPLSFEIGRANFESPRQNRNSPGPRKNRLT